MLVACWIQAAKMIGQDPCRISIKPEIPDTYLVFDYLNIFTHQIVS